ncbi:MAG: hypothetical protein EXS63_08085 [Candidatus Omnitrophica bacterium]|nr:hypothetical protein [Candidatus Omnitrophota bacterium]
MPTFIQNILSVISAGLGACLAIGIGVSHNQLCALISFAAGTLLGTTLFHIIPESASIHPAAIAIALGSGYLLFHLISRYVFHVCPACSASHVEEQTSESFKSIAILLTIGLSIHSTMDGMALALGKNLGEHPDHSVFLTILIHKFPEGLALCSLLLKSGYSKIRALLVTITLELSTLLGWFLGAFILTNYPAHHYIDLAMLHIGGGFAYLAVHAVINEARKHSPKVVVGFFAAGVGLMILTSVIH